MAAPFLYDVFLSHSAKDKAVVRDVAERLRKDGVKVWFDEWMLKPGDSIPSKIEEGLERSRVLVLCMSANAFGSDWAQLESGTFRFRDPLNKERRFLPLRLDDAPIRGSLAQFLHINWLPAVRTQEYTKLLEACKATATSLTEEQSALLSPIMGLFFEFGAATQVRLSSDLTKAITGSSDGSIRIWDVRRKRCIATDDEHSGYVYDLAWSRHETEFVSASDDQTLRVWDTQSGQCIALLEGHEGSVRSVAWSDRTRQIASGSKDKTIRIWEPEGSACVSVLAGHTGIVGCVAWTSDGRRVISGATDGTVRVWNAHTGRCESVSANLGDYVVSLAPAPGSGQFYSASRDGVIRLWDIETLTCEAVMEEHSRAVWSLRLTADKRWLLSASSDRTIRVWNTASNGCEATLEGHRFGVGHVTVEENGRRIVSVDSKGFALAWPWPMVRNPPIRRIANSIVYTNAKVLLAGESGAGKTGLSHRLTSGAWQPSESTVGVWATQWRVEGVKTKSGEDREIWLWDFGGQADQRLVHQLYMDRTALVLLVFDGDQEDVLPGLRDWLTALRRCVKEEIPHFLVAGRIDTGFKASRGKLQAFAKEQGLAYHETSAKSGDGCDELRAAMIASIPWAQMEKRTSPRVFKLIKDEILKLRDEGQVLHTFKELRELLWRRLPDEPRFTDETLQTVIGLLDGPGVVKELDYGTYILLAPEWINAYAQAVIRTLRSAENDLGMLPLRSIAEGKLIYQSIGRDGAAVEMKRLPTPEERVVLGEMERQLEQRGLCLRQGDKLVFPSHCGRDRPAVLEHPSVFVSYAVKGFLDDIYATLVVKLADSESFHLKELWRDAADFVTLTGDHHMGLKLTRESGSDGSISVYFGPGVAEGEQVIFANYIHAHLKDACEKALRLRHYVCPKCNAAKGNPELLMKKLLAKKQEADTECDGCGERFPLWDALEKKFANESLRQQVEGLQTLEAARSDARRKNKLLALEVESRIASADQKYLEVPATEEDRIDLELEFTDDNGENTGQRLYLHLISGNPPLEMQSNGGEIFAISDQLWVQHWLQQPHPVMLVIGTFSDDDERAIGKDKLEYAEVRWMEISSVLQRESRNGTKPVKQVEFKGERLDMESVHRWRKRILKTPLETE